MLYLSALVPRERARFSYQYFTGKESKPLKTRLVCLGMAGRSGSAWRWGNRRSKVLKQMVSSMRASTAPKQKCTPRPKPRWGLGCRVMSKTSGASKTVGSWFAAPSPRATTLPVGSVWPSGAKLIEFVDFLGNGQPGGYTSLLSGNCSIFPMV